MCGIYGIVSAQNNVDHNYATVFGSHNRRRGPDHFGLEQGEHFHLGMYRLAIVDVENGDQPIKDMKQHHSIFMNGEIYNYKELRKTLKNCSFYTKSDTEVALQNYLEHGIKSFETLNGMFALAIHDKENKTLTLARDRYGIKPLFYAVNDGVFKFSSSLMSFRDIENINKPNIVSNIISGYPVGGHTAFNDVNELRAGEHLTVKYGEDKIKLLNVGQSYNKLTPKFSYIVSRKKTQNIKTMIEEGIKLQFASEVKSAILLSGGIDSSLITSIYAKNFGAQSFDTLIARYNGKENTEFLRAVKVCSELKIEPKIVEINEPSTFAELLEYFDFTDEIFSDTAMFGTFALSKAAKIDGVKVLYSGAGADEIFGGYRRYHANIFNLSTLITQSNFLRFLLRTFSFDPGIRKRFETRQSAHICNISGHDLNFLKDIFVDFEIFNESLNTIASTYDTDLSSVRNVQTHDFNYYLKDNIFRMTDQILMYNGIEGRFPFMDDRVIKHLNHSKTRLKNKVLQPKAILHEMLNEQFPDINFRAKKVGFNAPANLWVSNIVKNDKERVFEFFKNNNTSLIDNNKLCEKLNAFDPKWGQTLLSIIAAIKWLNR